MTEHLTHPTEIPPIIFVGRSENLLFYKQAAERTGLKLSVVAIEGEQHKVNSMIITVGDGDVAISIKAPGENDTYYTSFREAYESLIAEAKAQIPEK